jgi:hypothetical protein
MENGALIIVVDDFSNLPPMAETAIKAENGFDRAANRCYAARSRVPIQI